MTELSSLKSRKIKRVSAYMLWLVGALLGGSQMLLLVYLNLDTFGENGRVYVPPVPLLMFDFLVCLTIGPLLIARLFGVWHGDTSDTAMAAIKDNPRHDVSELSWVSRLAMYIGTGIAMSFMGLGMIAVGVVLFFTYVSHTALKSEVIELMIMVGIVVPLIGGAAWGWIRMRCLTAKDICGQMMTIVGMIALSMGACAPVLLFIVNPGMAGEITTPYGQLVLFIAGLFFMLFLMLLGLRLLGCRAPEKMLMTEAELKEVKGAR